MILRIDRLQTELPPPSDAGSRGANAVQELIGGRFGEMSTLMNVHARSRSTSAKPPGRAAVLRPDREHRGRGVRPHRAGRHRDQHDAHRRVADRRRQGAERLAQASRASATRSTSSPAARARCSRTRTASPGTATTSSPPATSIEDLTHNFFLETGARKNKLKVYEMVDHPAARALTGYLLVRGGVHQVAYARAVEKLTGADLTKMFPSPRIPTSKIPECQPHIEKGEHLKLYRFSPNDYKEIIALFNGPHPETGEDSRSSTSRRRARCSATSRPAGRVRAGLRARGDPGDRRRSSASRRAWATSRWATSTCRRTRSSARSPTRSPPTKGDLFRGYSAVVLSRPSLRPPVRRR